MHYTFKNVHLRTLEKTWDRRLSVPRSVVNVRIYDYRFVKLYRDTLRLVRELLKHEETPIELARLIADMLYSANLIDSKQREHVFADLVWKFSKIQEDYYNRGCKSSVVVKIGIVLTKLLLDVFLEKKSNLVSKSSNVRDESE